ncbi:unnamed protein product [Schistosoma mattheei]|uniref:Uncharacterized protein n=1 Tax=Schistosoma mattheei TaxID=31246 RepID=A0A3P8HLW0_9TREM|nr:unnamed protein product [Schistosoma mattheei]
MKLEEKRHFVSSFCRTLATLLPHVIKDIELVNFPQDINISPLSQHETLDALLKWVVYFTMHLNYISVWGTSSAIVFFIPWLGGGL